MKTQLLSALLVVAAIVPMHAAQRRPATAPRVRPPLDGAGSPAKACPPGGGVTVFRLLNLKDGTPARLPNKKFSVAFSVGEGAVAKPSKFVEGCYKNFFDALYSEGYHLIFFKTKATPYIKECTVSATEKDWDLFLADWIQENTLDAASFLDGFTQWIMTNPAKKSQLLMRFWKSKYVQDKCKVLGRTNLQMLAGEISSPAGTKSALPATPAKAIFGK